MDRARIINEVDEHDGTTYAEPLAGLRVSWGAILAGALATVSVSLICWALAASITLSATDATASSVKGSVIALWICAMVTTLIGAVVGGWLAGYLPGNKNVFLGAAHGFLGWGLAFLLSSAIGFAAIGGMTTATTQATVTTAAATVQAAGSTVGGVAGGPMRLDKQATNLLESLGYTPAQASSMVSSAQAAIQKELGRQPGGPAAATDVRGALDKVINWIAGLTWSWFGTWFIAAILSVGAGSLAARQLRPHARRAPEIGPSVAEPVPQPA